MIAVAAVFCFLIDNAGAQTASALGAGRQLRQDLYGMALGLAGCAPKSAHNTGTRCVNVSASPDTQEE
jgi:hypothetical protein